VKKMVFITPPEAEYGFSLAGTRHCTVSGEEAEQALQRAMAEPDTGLVVLDERLIKGMGEERLRELEKQWDGIIITLPSPEGPEGEAEDFALSLIRRAIGYQVRLTL